MSKLIAKANTIIHEGHFSEATVNSGIYQKVPLPISTTSFVVPNDNNNNDHNNNNNNNNITIDLFSLSKEKTVTMQPSTDTNNNNISDAFFVSGGTNTQANTANNNDVNVMATNTDQQLNTLPIRLLCSEFFLENYGQVIAKLVQGCFFFGRKQQHGTTETKSSIQFIDTNLMDTCGVDIETPNGGAIVVSTLSGIQKTGLSQFLERIMELTATTRYHQLEIFVCIDVELDDAATQDVVELQTALLCSRNATKTHTTFKLSSMCSLAHCIAQRIYYSSFTSTSTSTTSTTSTATTTTTTTTTTVAGGTSTCNYSNSSSSLLSKVEHWLMDQRACRRLQFLLSITSKHFHILLVILVVIVTNIGIYSKQ